MNIISDELPPHLQDLLDLDVPIVDIMHGELKNLMVEAEEQYILAQQAEEESEEAMDSMERKYWEGQLDALTYLYTLTYNLSFAIADKETNA